MVCLAFQVNLNGFGGVDQDAAGNIYFTQPCGGLRMIDTRGILWTVTSASGTNSG